MNPMLPVFLISLFASVIGAICGIGGGVIIKPALDALQIMSVQQVSFLSGCTVLCMSAYSVFSAGLRGDRGLEMHTALPISLGAALGGVLGKLVFEQLSRGGSHVGLLQSACLLLLTLGTLLYTLYQARVRTKQLSGAGICACIGLLLGVLSSFLGIGGGPINLVALSFFFSMDTKTAAKNSLCIVLVSQIASLLLTFFTRSVPQVSVITLLIMACSGIIGGVLGRKVNQRICAQGVRRLFLAVNVAIIATCAYNVITAAA